MTLLTSLYLAASRKDHCGIGVRDNCLHFYFRKKKREILGHAFDCVLSKGKKRKWSGGKMERDVQKRQRVNERLKECEQDRICFWVLIGKGKIIHFDSFSEFV